ncbi:MAG: tyrosine-type recombinase/integrase [Eubacterium sp.]|nr:tyrosine-type recombinase/integrase [Eubacterium sp.]
MSLSDSNSEWLFPSRNPNKAEWERSYNFDKTIRRVCREINIPVRSMHKLRKTYSANLLAAGYPEKFVQKQLGHSDIKTTQKAYNYDIFDSTDKERAIRDFEVGKALLTYVNPDLD